MDQLVEDLDAAVSAGMAAGQSLEQLQQSVKLEKYRDWKSYERRSTYSALVLEGGGPR